MIPSKLPSSVRTPGAYSSFDFTGGALSLIQFDKRIVAIGEMTAAGTAVVETPIQIFGEADADLKAGQGSFGALMCRAAIKQQLLSGAGCQIWFCGVAEPGGGTKAAYTITITGPATEANTLEFWIAGRFIQVGVSNGDSVTTIALAIKAQFDAMKSVLPFTCTAAIGVVTLTITTKGVNGNDLLCRLNKKPTGTTFAFANTVPGVGAATITNALAALYDQPYDGIGFSNHTTADIANLLLEAAIAWGYQQKSYRYFFVGENGSLSTAETLQAASNDFRVLVTSYEQSGSLPGELAMMTAAAAYSRDNPNANLDGEDFAAYPPPPSYAYTAPEVESALAAGVIPIVPNGPFGKLISLITSQISYNSAPFEPLRDFANSRTSSWLAKQIELTYSVRLRQQIGDEDFLERVRVLIIGIMRLAQASSPPILRDVDSFLDTIKAEYAFVNSTRRVATTSPHRVASPVHQIDNNMIMFL